ncbi:ABC transporter permease [Sporolactobacillus terrae]|uniref:Transport permease protein n=1 Tax=Sporolactobacillus terrae TaxID=269673 RepID=A0ABX5Q5H6_9BACL|nr:ABC transporter permease [Sporolactobacillus terrae]QAA21879.1 ABC transporter [Sporolactobacillus terrae]QAA24852.1 ABC transporter [Sporolactobacillus terrae]UAK16673.1 ABC transporter permease [Sporolactobacillus terrae]
MNSEQQMNKMRAALVDHKRPPHPNGFATSLAFTWRALLKIKYVPEQLLDVTFFPVMFTLMFTYLFGGALAGSTTDYLQFLIPGILVQTVVFTTVYTGVSLNEDISKGTFDRFRSMPIWGPSPLVGALLADTVRYTLASIIVIILGLILGFRPAGSVLGVVAGIMLVLIFSFSLSWVFTMLGLILQTTKAVMGISMTLLFPVTFASNIFVDPATMPGWLRAFVNINPVSILTTSLRQLMGGQVNGMQIIWVLVVSAVLILIFAPVTMYLYRNKR